jgi:hypothetical protein|tara:strand:+ start:110 stop:1039 length:930 start_codon:yes stop_codon:yes gene_type:complete
MYYRSPETFFTDFEENSDDYQDFMRKISSIMMLMYSDIMPSSNPIRKEDMQNAISKIYKFSLTPNATVHTLSFVVATKPGFYYPPQSLSRSNLELSPITNRNRRVEFVRFDKEMIGSSFFSVEKAITEISEGVFESTKFNDRPTLETFVKIYDALLNGELPKLEVDGFIPLNYLGQPVIGNSRPSQTLYNRGPMISATEVFPNGLNLNQLLFLTTNQMVTYGANPPSTPIHFLFRIREGSEGYCLMTLTNSKVDMRFIPNWAYCKEYGFEYISHGISSWAQGDSVFEFRWGSTSQTIHSYNYGVNGFVV